MPKRIYPPTTVDRQPVPLTANELSKLRELLESLRTTADDIRELNREGHELLKDLRAERAKAEKVLPMIVAKRISAEVDKQIRELGDETEEAMALAAKKVYAEFDRIRAMLMGEDEPGKPTLLEMLDNIGPILPLIKAIMDGEFRVGNLTVTDGATGEIAKDLSVSVNQEGQRNPRALTSEEQNL